MRTAPAILVTIFLGLVLVAVSYFAIYWVLVLGVNPFMPLSAPWWYLIALALVGLLFIGNTVGSSDDFQEFTIPTPDGKKIPVRVPISGILADAPETPHGVLKTVTVLLCIGPRTVSSAMRFFRRASRLAKLDVMGCSAVITVLLSQGRRVAFEDINQKVENLDPVRVLPQLGDVEGVLFLKKEPQGLSIGTELRAEFARYGIGEVAEE